MRKAGKNYDGIAAKSPNAEEVRIPQSVDAGIDMAKLRFADVLYPILTITKLMKAHCELKKNPAPSNKRNAGKRSVLMNKLLRYRKFAFVLDRLAANAVFGNDL